VDALTLDDVADALVFIDPNCSRNDWAQIAMAIKSEFGNQGFMVFDEWSQGGDSYNQNDCQSTWKSVRASGGVGIGTLISRAKDGGYQPKQQQKLTPEQKKQREADQKKRRETIEKQAEKDKEELNAWHERNAEACQRILDIHLDNMGKSKYLQRKKVAAFGIGFVTHGLVIITYLSEKRVDVITGKDDVSKFFDYRNSDEYDGNAVTFKYFKAGTIAIPMRDMDGKLWSLQFINENGSKQFLKLSRKKELFHLVSKNQPPTGGLINDDDQVIAFAEGYATAASILMATSWPTAVAFDAGNLAHVAAGFRGVYPDKKLLICGDNDSHKPTNTGLESATATAHQVNGIAALPTFAKQAFNL